LGHIGHLVVASCFPFASNFACLWRGFHTLEPHVVLFQNENSLYANPFVDWQSNDDNISMMDANIQHYLPMVGIHP